MAEVADRIGDGSKRRKRARREGTVVANSGAKTVRVRCDFSVKHPKYGKYLRRFTVLHSHDENNEANVGDIVEIASCRRLSKTKCWRLVRIVSKR